jgi:superfamily II DNA/RNA helicase
VVHVDPPAEHKAYLHRSGRTARAGNSGDVVTVVLPEQRRDTSDLMRRAGIAVRPQQVTAQSEPVVQLVGEVAPYQAPTARPVTAQPAQRSQPRRRPNRGGEHARAARSGQRTGGHGHRAGARSGASRHTS